MEIFSDTGAWPFSSQCNRTCVCMSLSPRPSKLVPLIDQSLYESSGYLISNSEGSEGGRTGNRGNVNAKAECVGGGKSKGGTEGEREEERGKRETDCAAGLPCK